MKHPSLTAMSNWERCPKPDKYIPPKSPIYVIQSLNTINLAQHKGLIQLMHMLTKRPCEGIVTGSYSLSMS